MADILFDREFQPSENEGATSRAPQSHLSSSQIAQPYEDMARALQGVGRGLEEASQGLEQGATYAAEKQAYEDLGKQKITRDPSGNIQVLNPANSVFWGQAGRHYEEIVRRGTATQAGQLLNLGMVEDASRNMLNPAGFKAATDARLDQFQQQFGNTAWGGEAAMHGRERQVEHLEGITNRAALNDIQNSKISLEAQIKSDKEDLLGLAATPGSENSPQFQQLHDRLYGNLDSLTSNPLYKTPQNLVDLEKKQFETQMAGERVSSTIPKLIDEQGMPAARKAIDDFLGRGDLEPAIRRQVGASMRAELAEATPKWREENRGFDATVEGIKKGLASGTLSADDPNIRQAVTQGRARGYDREPELEALVANAPWMKRMGPLTPAQRSEAAGLPAPEPFSGPAAFSPHFGARGFVPSQNVYDALVAKGFTPNAARGLLGNLMYESGGGGRGGIYLDPATDAGQFNFGTGDAGVGAAQWEGGRKGGVAPTLQSQVDKIWQEFNNPGSAGMPPGVLQRLQAAASPGEAAEIVNTLYERPQKPGASAAERRQYAYSALRNAPSGPEPAVAAAPRAAASTSSRWTDAEVKANPWLLAGVFQTGSSDPSEKLSYFNATIGNANQTMKFGNLPDQRQSADIETMMESHRGDPRWQEKYDEYVGRLDATLADRLPPEERAAWKTAVGGAAASQGDPWVKAQATAALEWSTALDKQWREDPYGMAQRTKMIPGLPAFDPAHPETVGAAVQARIAASQTIAARRPDEPAPPLIPPADAPAFKAILNGPQGGPTLIAAAQTLQPADLMRLGNEEVFVKAVDAMRNSTDYGKAASAFAVMGKMNAQDSANFDVKFHDGLKDLAWWDSRGSGLTPQEFAKEQAERHDPGFEEKMRPFDKAAETFITDNRIDARVVAGRVANAYFGHYEPGGTANAELLYDWKNDLYAGARQGMDINAAAGYADQRARNKWQPSAVNGGVLTAYAPEVAVRNPDGSPATVNGSMNWLGDSLDRDLKQILGLPAGLRRGQANAGPLFYGDQARPLTQAETDNLNEFNGARRLVGDGQTHADIASGKWPSYGLFLQDANGAWFPPVDGNGRPARITFDPGEANRRAQSSAIDQRYLEQRSAGQVEDMKEKALELLQKGAGAIEGPMRQGAGAIEDQMRRGAGAIEEQMKRGAIENAPQPPLPPGFSPP